MVAAAGEPDTIDVKDLPQIRRLRVCPLGATPDGSSFQVGFGKSDLACALLRGLTADRPSEADPILDLAFDYGVFERAWWDLLKEVPEDSPAIERWGVGPLNVWDVEGRLRYDRRAPGESTPPFDSDPVEDCASLCAGHSEKLNFGHKRSPGLLRCFRETLVAAGHDVAVLETLQRELQKAAAEKPRELVRKDRPCPGLLASFARFSPEVGDLNGCETVFLHVFEPGARPLGSQRNIALLYAAAPTSWAHRGHPPGTFVLALSALGSNVSRLVREYNRLAAGCPVPEAWERALWWQTDLRARVEYYFCDRALRIERYIRDKIVGQEDGWLDLEVVRNFPRIACSGATLQEELLDSLKDSKCVDTKLGEDGKAFVRRAGGKPLPNLDDARKRRYGGGEVPSTWAKRRNTNSDDPKCWDWVRRGTCPRGDKCKYLHDTPAASAPAVGGEETRTTDPAVSEAAAAVGVDPGLFQSSSNETSVGPTTEAGEVDGSTAQTSTEEKNE